MSALAHVATAAPHPTPTWIRLTERHFAKASVLRLRVRYSDWATACTMAAGRQLVSCGTGYALVRATTVGSLIISHAATNVAISTRADPDQPSRCGSVARVAITMATPVPATAIPSREPNVSKEVTPMSPIDLDKTRATSSPAPVKPTDRSSQPAVERHDTVFNLYPRVPLDGPTPGAA